MHSYEEAIHFKATNPVLAAALAPALAAPLPLLVLLNQIEGFWKSFAIGFFMIYFISMAAVTFYLSFRKFDVSIEKSVIQIGKKQYKLVDIQKVTFKNKSKYIYLKVKQMWGTHTFCIQDQLEYDRVVTVLTELASEQGIEIENS